MRGAAEVAWRGAAEGEPSEYIVLCQVAAANEPSEFQQTDGAK